MGKTFFEWCEVLEANDNANESGAKKKRKPYSVRLNPEDAEYGVIDRKAEPTQNSLEAWDAAWQNTMRSIMESLPATMQMAINKLREKETRGEPGKAKVRPRLAWLREDATCPRCGGSGKRDEWKGWLHHGSLGRVCYRCHGSGIKTSMEPVFFRRRAIDYIKDFITERKYDQLDKWADKVIGSTEEQQPYRPVLIDVAELIKQKKYREIFRLPH